jgi:AraC-like DNA-binding protein
MTLNLNQRALIQSGMEAVVPIGPDPQSRIDGSPHTTGTYKVLGIRSGLNVTVFDVIVGTRFGRTPVRSEPCLAIDVLFDAAGRGWLLPPDGSAGVNIPYRQDQLYLFFADGGATGVYDVPAGSRFRGVDIRLDMAFLEQLGVKSLFGRLKPSHGLHAASCPGCWIGVTPLPGRLATTARAIYDLALRDDSDLLVEARCLEMITAALSMLDEAPPRRADARHRRKLEEARNLLLSDLAHPWKVAELARRVGLNEKNLKSGFRQAFGSPVYQYLQSARLNEARRQLLSPDARITAVAQSVGYSSPSHFAKLFVREFGQAPTAFRDRDDQALDADTLPRRS